MEAQKKANDLWPPGGDGDPQNKITLVPFWGMETKKNTKKKKIGPFWGLENQKNGILTKFNPWYNFGGAGSGRIGSDRSGSVRIGEKKNVRGFSSSEWASVSG
jgi:hypothetical protein